LTELKLNSIPQIIVFNKSDLGKSVEVSQLERQVCLDKPVECVSISAIRRETLRPLVERIAVRIGKFALTQPV
jgi:50S ribosomal subunit-associated GTPase HflX